MGPLAIRKGEFCMYSNSVVILFSMCVMWEENFYNYFTVFVCPIVIKIFLY